MKLRHLILAFIAVIVPPGFGWQADELDPLVHAIGQVESGHNDAAVGDGGDSFGRFQIQWACWKDATDFDKTIGGTYKDVHDPVYAEKVMRAYWRRYEPKAYATGDYEALSRLWNSGPAWAKKKHKTDAYWAKVKRELDK
jgi:hypothetical protein